MSGNFHAVWCPHPHCNVGGFSTGTPGEDAAWLAQHVPFCDGVRFDRDTAATAERMHTEALWERVERRWSAKHTQRAPGST